MIVRFDVEPSVCRNGRSCETEVEKLDGGSSGSLPVKLWISIMFEESHYEIDASKYSKWSERPKVLFCLFSWFVCDSIMSTHFCMKRSECVMNIIIVDAPSCIIDTKIIWWTRFMGWKECVIHVWLNIKLCI